MEATKEKNNDLLALTADIVASHVSNNSVPAGEVAGLIEEVFKTLQSVEGGGDAEAVQREPAVPIKKSITPDYIICLEDGKKLKMLKRHLKSRYDLTPEEYRKRWGLGLDYPMVAPNYAERRRDLAKKIGLGKNRRKS